MTGKDSEDKFDALQEEILRIIEGIESGASVPPAGEGTQRDAEVAEGHEGEGGGLLGMLSMDEPLREVYLRLLRSEPMTLAEMKASDLFADFDEREFLEIYVKTLMRQGVLKRVKTDAGVKYEAVVGERKSRKVHDDLWGLL
ncbi:MAG: hypothetical protein D6820_00985, partial [Lentisphaerae bacterium]